MNFFPRKLQEGGPKLEDDKELLRQSEAREKLAGYIDTIRGLRVSSSLSGIAMVNSGYKPDGHIQPRHSNKFYEDIIENEKEAKKVLADYMEKSKSGLPIVYVDENFRVVRGTLELIGSIDLDTLDLTATVRHGDYDSPDQIHHSNIRLDAQVIFNDDALADAH